MSRGKIHKYCKFPGCPSVYRSKESIRFHSFPKHPPTLKIWREICHLDASANVQNLRMCSKHFNNLDYNNHYLKMYLNCHAIPRAAPVNNNNNKLTPVVPTSRNKSGNLSYRVKMVGIFATWRCSVLTICCICRLYRYESGNLLPFLG